MLVHNKDKRVHGFAANAVEAVKAGVDPQVVLKPGVNDIDPKAWELVKGTLAMKHHLKEGTIEVLSNAPAKAEVKLSELDQAEALEVVGLTLDRDLLIKWAKGEKRQPVNEAIGAQLEKVKVEKKKQE
jgi:hypothetical protein